MRNVYKYLAYAIPVLVAVQAAAIAFAFFGLSKWIEDGATLDKASMESQSTDFTGVVGFMIHGMVGEMLIPLVAVLLLISSFFAKIPGGSMWAGLVVIDVILQIVFAFSAMGAPAVGMVHGLNALLLAWLGWTAAHRVASASATSAERSDLGVSAPAG